MTVNREARVILRTLTMLTLLTATVAAMEPEKGQPPSPETVQPPTPVDVDLERQQNMLVPDQRTEPTLRGYCPVAYFTEGKPVKGDPQYRAQYGGHTYHLSSEKAQKAFEEHPEKYLPEFDGLCTMALGGPYGNRFLGHPEVFELRMARLYLFSSERAKRHYLQTPEDVLESAKKRFAVPMIDGYCPVSYHTEKEPRQGSAEFHAPWQGRTYHFVSAEAHDEFLKNPAKYAPQYRAYCAASIARNIRRDADPKLFRVFNDHTYLFSSEAARGEFDADPQAVIKKADTNWSTLMIMR